MKNSAIIESVSSFAAEWWKSKILDKSKNKNEEDRKLVLSLINKEINSAQSLIKFKDALKLEIKKMLNKHGNIELVLSTDKEPVGILGEIASRYGMKGVGCFPENTTMIVSADFIACRDANGAIEYVYKSKNKENEVL